MSEESKHDESPVLSAHERGALESDLPTFEPPDDFADRVLRARDEAAGIVAAERPRGRRRSRAIGGAAILAVAAAAVFFVIGNEAAHGELRASARTSAELGERAIAVLEQGAALRYDVAMFGAAKLEQSAGNVFYRVNRGGTFDVRTPSGTISVRGTCFRVEVVPMPVSRQHLTGATIGAALAAATLVTVYEGRVVLANDHGSTTITAGQRARAEAGGRPGSAEDAPEIISGGGVALNGNGSAAGSGSAHAPRTEAELRAAYTSANVRIAALEAALARARGGDGTGTAREPSLDSIWYPASPEDLAFNVQNCRIQMDTPPIFNRDPFHMEAGGERARELGLADEEIPIMNDAVERVRREFIEQLRPLYVEATGDAPGASSLSASAMYEEIQDKAPEDEPAQIRQRYAQERAGMIPPPGDLSTTSPAERALRLHAAQGDRLQELVALSVGPERARQLRATRGGWPWSRSSHGGCPDPH